MQAETNKRKKQHRTEIDLFANFIKNVFKLDKCYRLFVEETERSTDKLITYKVLYLS